MKEGALKTGQGLQVNIALLIKSVLNGSGKLFYFVLEDRLTIVQNALLMIL